MARTMITTLLAAALAMTAHAGPIEARASTVTCNIDNLTFPSAYAAHACSAIPAHITVTGPQTLLASSPDNPDIQVILHQTNLNWSGSGSQATALCNSILTACGGTVGVAEQNGASVTTNGDFGDASGYITLSW
ncbi:hypothetical protein MMC09_007006 [Bachmanniomyces sp. S44760]|nr:hypothetical protein [Bachmanniomyces sp. S44760]